MRCCDCEYYKSGHMWNYCALTESEYFRTVDDCTLVNDDKSINYNDDYFNMTKLELYLQKGKTHEGY